MCYLQPMHHSMPGANHHHIHTQLFSRIVCHIIIWWYIGAILAAPHRGAKGCHPPCRRWSIDVLFSTQASQFSVNSFKPSQRPWDVSGQLEFVCPRHPQRHKFRMLDKGPYLYLISILGGCSLILPNSVNSFKPSQPPWDVSGQLEFVCPRHPQRHKFRMLDKGLTFILLAYWEGAVLSSLYIGRTSPASPCRLNLFLSPRKSHTIGGPSTICWPVDCYLICRCPIPPLPPPRPRPIWLLMSRCIYSWGYCFMVRIWIKAWSEALRSNGFRSIGKSGRFHNWYLIYFAVYQEAFLPAREAKFLPAREAKVRTQSNSNQHTRRLFSIWERKFFFSQQL